VTVLSGQTIRRLGLVTPCLERTEHLGMTHGLGPAGYDVRLDLGEEWLSRSLFGGGRSRNERWLGPGEFILAATCERFTLPANVNFEVKDKSSLARRGLSLFNTVAEPGWCGWLTLEIVNHSKFGMLLTQGMPIAQVVFHCLDEPAEKPYAGKYQNQAAGPVGAR
jgi:dCTP deaminase